VKVRAVRAVLNSGYLSGLITDERTARALVDTAPNGRSAAGNCK
jgi:DNA-binding transcriptional regulator LsrR (DeoR family)